MSILCRCRDLSSRDVVIRLGLWILVVVKNNIMVLGPGLDLGVQVLVNISRRIDRRLDEQFGQLLET